MKKNILFFLVAGLLFSFIILHSCSWTTGFYIKNLSNDTISVELCLEEFEKGFPIFEHKTYNQYKLRRKDRIDFHKNMSTITAESDDDALCNFFVIPPGYTVRIGYLSNDKYEKYDQYFINSRVFNLKTLSIKTPKDTLEIIPPTFDNYFESGKSGGISYSVE